MDKVGRWRGTRRVDVAERVKPQVGSHLRHNVGLGYIMLQTTIRSLQTLDRRDGRMALAKLGGGGCDNLFGRTTPGPDSGAITT